MKFKDTYYRTINYILEDMIMIEGLDIKNFNKTVPSTINKDKYKERKETGVGTFLNSVKWNNKKDTLTLFFNVTPTSGTPVDIVSKKGKISKGSKYKTEIQFENVSKFLGKKKDFLSNSKGDQIKKVRSLTSNGSVRIHSNDLSFLFQGVWRRSVDGDYNVYNLPSNRTVDTGIWKTRHGKNKYATKHIMSCIDTIPFISANIAKLIRETN